MKKRFNTTGNCRPARHYMMDNSAKVAKALELIENGEYFVLNRPRQYGKTTTLFAVAEKLAQTEEFLPIRMNFQGIDSKWHESDASFARMFAEELEKYLSHSSPQLAELIRRRPEPVSDMGKLSELITELVKASPKKLVLLIDEVDASANYEPFLSFLGMLRTKYLDRDSPIHYTFHSVMLVGVHDIKSLKHKLRNPEQAQYNSPWNIAVNFNTEMEFNPREIKPMLEEYAQAENVQMETDKIAELLFYHTSGYPFLVSRLCQIIAEDIMPNKKEKIWTEQDIEKALKIIYKENNPNFESLIKNLQNHQDLYELVYSMLILGHKYEFNIDNETIKKGVVYGVFSQNGSLKIHNRIYAQRIYNYLISNIELSGKIYQETESQFQLADGGLNFELVLRRFQSYALEAFGQKDKAFLEREWRLIFLAFLRPIINGKGYDFKEVQISDERRLDVVITYGAHRYLVELKIWRGQDYHERGLAQLKAYMDSLGMKEGYLVIFDAKKEHQNRSQWQEIEGKKVFAVWI